MDQAPNLQDQNEPTDDMDARVAAALASVDDADDTQASAEADVSTREAADLEEKLQSELIARARADSDQMGTVEEERIKLVDAAKDRNTLLAAMRQHQKLAQAKPAYVPPPRTERQLSQLELEQEAGRRAQAKQQAQWDNRPVPPRDTREGSSQPVHRPNNIVPDPKIAAIGGFAAGTAIFDPSK